MSTRISSAAALLLLALTGCRQPVAESTVAEKVEREPLDAAALEDRLECAVDGAAVFSRACTLDREDGDDGPVITLRHADGGFRRLRITQDGHGVVAADGAEPALVTATDRDTIEVQVGRDRYRLPAAMRGVR